MYTEIYFVSTPPLFRSGWSFGVDPWCRGLQRATTSP